MAKDDREWAKLTDERGVDLMTTCVVPTCTTGVTRRAGICSTHWHELTVEERTEIQAASKKNDRGAWIKLVRRAASRLAAEESPL